MEQQVRNPSPLFSRYFATSRDRGELLQKRGSRSELKKKYSRKHLEVLASPTNFFKKTSKPSIFELLREQYNEGGSPKEEKPTVGTYPFRSVPREFHRHKDEGLPPGYYTPNYDFVERSSPAPNFKNSPKKETLFARIRAATPLDFNSPSPEPLKASVKEPTYHGFTSFAKMSSRTELFRFNQGANEKRFENYELYSWDRKNAIK